MNEAVCANGPCHLPAALLPGCCCPEVLLCIFLGLLHLSSLCDGLFFVVAMAVGPRASLLALAVALLYGPSAALAGEML